MLNHGLDEPLITIADNEVLVVLRGPGEDMNRIRIPENITAGRSPSVAATLNERQKTVLPKVCVRKLSIREPWILHKWTVGPVCFGLMCFDDLKLFVILRKEAISKKQVLLKS